MGDSTRLGLGLITAAFLACGGRSNVLGATDGGDASAAQDPGGGGEDGGVLPEPADAAPAIDLLAACNGERNVFAYEVLAYPGPFELGAKRFTNHDASWYGVLEPNVEVNVLAGSGAGGSIAVWTPPQKPLTPGDYPQGPATANAAPTIHAVFSGGGCNAESGMLTIVELTTSKDDGGSPHLDSFVASFDLVCGWETGPIPVRGCIRYGRSP